MAREDGPIRDIEVSSVEDVEEFRPEFEFGGLIQNAQCGIFYD